MYYAVSYSAGTFGANRYLVFFLTSLIEIPSYWTCIVLNRKYVKSYLTREMLGGWDAAWPNTGRVLARSGLGGFGWPQPRSHGLSPLTIWKEIRMLPGQSPRLEIGIRRPKFQKERLLYRSLK